MKGLLDACIILAASENARDNFSLFTSAETRQSRLSNDISLYVRYTRQRYYINYHARNFYLYFGRGGGLLRGAIEERYTSGSKERMSFALVCVKGLFFIYIQYTYHARLQSLFAHNHAALKSHKVHDRVLH